jgi:hypothetical protein
MAPKLGDRKILIESTDTTNSLQKDANPTPAVPSGGGAPPDASPLKGTSKVASSQKLPGVKEPTVGKPIPHKRIVSSNNEHQVSPHAHLPPHQRRAAEAWEDERWAATRDWFAEFFQVYRDGKAEPTVFADVSPWVPERMVNLGNWFRDMFMKYGVRLVFALFVLTIWLMSTTANAAHAACLQVQRQKGSKRVGACASACR